MSGGTISGNNADNGGGVRVEGATFRMVNGTIYGSNEGALSNTATTTPGAALFNGGTAQRGTLSGVTWTSLGNLTDTDTTIRVVDGVLQ